MSQFADTTAMETTERKTRDQQRTPSPPKIDYLSKSKDRKLLPKPLHVSRLRTGLVSNSTTSNNNGISNSHKPLKLTTTALIAPNAPNTHNALTAPSEFTTTPNSNKTQLQPKTKGLNIFAVSPITPSSITKNSALQLDSTDLLKRNGSQLRHQRRRSSIISESLPLPLLIETSDDLSFDEKVLFFGPSSRKSPELKYDVPLPLNEKLREMSIDEQLRLLALKEMCLVEIKDQIQNLNSKLSSHENELHDLRQVIQRSLYQELSGATSNNNSQNDSMNDDNNSNKHNKNNGGNLDKNNNITTSNLLSRQRTNSNPRDQALESLRGRRRALLIGPNKEDEIKKTSEEDSKSKIWSGLTKSLNVLNQLDSFVSNEFEQSLKTNKDGQIAHSEQQQQQKKHHSSHKPRNSEDSITSVGTVSSPLQSRSARSLLEYRASQDRKSDDMIHTVSSSIWSFVNEVKTNVLASLSEETDYGKPPQSPQPLQPLQPRPSQQSQSQQNNNIHTLDNGSVVSLDNDRNVVKQVLPNCFDDLELLIDLEDDYEAAAGEKLDLSIYKKME